MQKSGFLMARLICYTLHVMSVYCRPPYTPLLQRETGVYSGIQFCSPEPKAHKVSLWYTSRAGVCCPSVCVSVCVPVCPHFQALISSQPVTEPIAINFYLIKTSLGWGEGCINFGPDRIRTLVFMATDSSHKVMIG